RPSDEALAEAGAAAEDIRLHEPQLDLDGQGDARLGPGNAPWLQPGVEHVAAAAEVAAAPGARRLRRGRLDREVDARVGWWLLWGCLRGRRRLQPGDEPLAGAAERGACRRPAAGRRLDREAIRRLRRKERRSLRPGTERVAAGPPGTRSRRGGRLGWGERLRHDRLADRLRVRPGKGPLAEAAAAPAG